MDNIKQINKPIKSGEQRNKVLDAIPKIQLFKEIISKDTLKDIEIKKHSLFTVNILNNKLKIEKNDKGEYRITKTIYNRFDLEDKKEIEDSLKQAYNLDKTNSYSLENIDKFLNKDLEVIKYYYNNKSLNNGFLPVYQKSYCDYNRSCINFNEETGEIESINNPLKKELYLTKGFIEEKGLILPNQTEVETNTISLLSDDIKEFIKEIDNEVVELTISEIEEDLLNRGYSLNSSNKVFKDIILSSFSEEDKIKKIKEEYGTSCTRTHINNVETTIETSPGLGIMYRFDNGQVFPFTWKKVHDIFNNKYSPKKVEEIKVVEKVEVIDNNAECLKEDVINDIIDHGTGFYGGEERVREIILDQKLEEKEKIKKIKEEYGTGGSSAEINGIKGFQDHDQGFGIKYRLDNGQRFTFDWKNVYLIYKDHYSSDKLFNELKKEEVQIIPKSVLEALNRINDGEVFYYQTEKERDEELNIIKQKFGVDQQGNSLNLQVPVGKYIDNKGGKSYFIYGISAPYKQGEEEIKSKQEQIGLFDTSELFEDIKEEVKEIDNINEGLEIEEMSEFKDPIRFELKKKSLFGLIENNIMGKYVLEKQPIHKNIDDFTKKQLDEVRELINKNELIKARTPQLRCLYDNYNLENIDDINGEKGEFSKIFNTVSREYTKATFQLKIDKIVKRINDYDNPVQTLEDYFHSIRTKEFNLASMDLEKYKKIVSGMTTIFNHDLLTISTKDKASVISYINKFMRNAKQYIIDNNLDFKIANDILAEGFLRNYKTVVL